MKKETQTQVLLAARAVIADKGYDCSLREIANAAGVSYGHVHRTWATKEALMEAAECLLYEELTKSLGASSAVETLPILLVKTWFSLKAVPDARRFLAQTMNPSYPVFALVNPLQERIKSACEAHHPKLQQPSVVAATIYTVAINVDPCVLKRACSDFEIPHLPEEVSIMALNYAISFFPQ